MKVKELAPKIFAKEHTYYDQILEAKTWSEVAVLHYAQEVSDKPWQRYLESIGLDALQNTRDTIAELIREARNGTLVY
jgi:Xaa-Pro aminopeptidase